MKIIGVILISVIPLLLGLKKCFGLKTRVNTLKLLCDKFKEILDEISYTKRELRDILKALNISKYINLDVFPIKINSKALLEDGILKEEIINIENFISSLQNGDEKYVKSMGGLYLKKINEQALKALKDLNLKEEIFLKSAAGISVMVFLVLI